MVATASIIPYLIKHSFQTVIFVVVLAGGDTVRLTIPSLMNQESNINLLNHVPAVRQDEKRIEEKPTLSR